MRRTEIDDGAIVEAALDEFSEFSYEEASLNRIIKRAGVSKGSFYYRFDNKYELYLHLLKTCTRSKWEYIHNGTTEEPGPGPDEDIFSHFRYQAELGIRFATAFPKMDRLARMFSREKGTAVYDAVLAVLDDADESGLQQLVDTAYEKGEFDERYSREFVFRVVGYLFESFGDIFSLDANTDMEAMRELVVDFVHFMENGLVGVTDRGDTHT